MDYILSKVFGILLTPGIVFMFGLSVGTALLWSRRHWRGGRRLLTVLVVVLVGLIASPLQPFLIESLEDRFAVDFTSGGGPEWTNVDVPIYRLRLLAQAIHEWIGLIYYQLSGWTDTLFPGP